MAVSMNQDTEKVILKGYAMGIAGNSNVSCKPRGYEEEIAPSEPFRQKTEGYWPDEFDEHRYYCSEIPRKDITPEALVNLSLSCQTPTYLHKGEADWMKYVLETCESAAKKCGHFSFQFGVNKKVNWRQVGRLIGQRGFKVSYYESGTPNGSRMYEWDGPVPDSVDTMNVAWASKDWWVANEP